MKTRPSIGTYYKVPNPGLRAYFRHTEDGNIEDYRPPFWKGKSRESVLSMWQKILDDTGVKTKYPGLYEYELEMKSKVGPMSIQKPLNQRLDSIEAYYKDVEAKSVPIKQEAIDAALDWVKPIRNLRLRSKQHTIENMRLNTNSGSPFFTKRKNVADILDFSIDNGDMHQGPWTLAATLGWRGQEGGPSPDDVKQRVIWMMPFVLNVQELRYYQPAIEAAQKTKLIPAYVSMDYVDQEVTALFDSKGVDDVVICTDFTRFDQHFNRHMADAAEQMIGNTLTLTDEAEKWLFDIFPIKYHIPLICSEDLMYTGYHGMGSGSGGTNFDESLAHKALQFEAAITANATLNPHSMAYGDDGILTFPGIDVEHVIQTYERHGQVMNPEKQYVSKHDCVVLRRWHSTHYRVNGTMVGVYSTFRALGRLLAQERYYDPDKWSAEMVTLRALSILENCKWSPYFHEFIDFVITGDKYQLGLAIPGFFERLQKMAQKAIENFDDFLGYTKTLQNPDSAAGINDWEVVKYLKNKQ